MSNQQKRKNRSAVILGRAGGQARSEAKAAAARRNASLPRGDGWLILRGTRVIGSAQTKVAAAKLMVAAKRKEAKLYSLTPA